MVPRDWQELYDEYLDKYLEETSALVLIRLDQNLEICQCNQGFLKIMGLCAKPLGEKITTFLLPGEPALPVLPAVGESLSVRLPLHPRNAAVHLLISQIINTGQYYLIVGEKLQLMESKIVSKISDLNQEMANLTRQLQQQNRALQDMMAKIRQSEAEKEKLIKKLQEALLQVKTLRGLLPICSACKKIRNDQGYWQQIEGYIKEHSEADFTHSICPDCMVKLYGDFLSSPDDSTS